MGSKELEHDSLAISASAPVDQQQDLENKDEVPGTPDRVKISNDTMTYTNSGHWTSILDGVKPL